MKIMGPSQGLLVAILGREPRESTVAATAAQVIVVDPHENATTSTNYCPEN